MERKLLKRFRGIIVFVSFLFVLVFAACEIGLGSSVDTEPPTLTITYPSADVVIRDAFVLAGSCNDDEALDTVTVLLKETATNTSYGPFEIQIPEREEGGKSGLIRKITGFILLKTAVMLPKFTQQIKVVRFLVNLLFPLILIILPQFL